MSQTGNDKPNNAKMKRLEDIEKKNIYSVPEGYFEDLPMKIQARIADKSKSETPVFIGALRYALPAVLLVAVAYFGIFRMAPTQQDDPLAGVSTEDIISYLASTDITTDEILSEVNLDDFTLDYLNTEEEILNDIELGDEDLQDLYDQLDSEYL